MEQLLNEGGVPRTKTISLCVLTDLVLASRPTPREFPSPTSERLAALLGAVGAVSPPSRPSRRLAGGLICRPTLVILDNIPAPLVRRHESPLITVLSCFFSFCKAFLSSSLSTASVGSFWKQLVMSTYSEPPSLIPTGPSHIDVSRSCTTRVPQQNVSCLCGQQPVAGCLALYLPSSRCGAHK